MAEVTELIASLARGEELGEEARMALVKHAVREPDRVIEEFSRRVGGEAVPDTVVVQKAVEVVLAAIALRRAKNVEKPLRVLVPKEPVPGWQPLRLLVEDYASRGLIHVYEYPSRPRTKPSVRNIASQIARIARGFSARTVDVTDAPPYAVAALYSAGVRVLTMLVPLEHILFFQKFSYTVPV